MIRALKLPAAALVGLSLLACAPAGDRDADTAAIDTAPVTLSPAPGAPAAGTPGAPATTPEPATGTRTIHVVLTEWALTPSERTFPAGTVQFHAMNEGRHTHSLEIQRGSNEWVTQPIPPGGTGAVVINVTPGTYTLYCPIVDSQGNHSQRGMQTTITVQ